VSVAKLSDSEYLEQVREEVLLRVLADLASRGMKYEATLLAAVVGLQLPRYVEREKLTAQSYPVKIPI
jgi:hypothetical protein